MALVTLDFETYYDKKNFSLSSMTTEAYIRDPRFEVIGVSIKVDDKPARWFSGERADKALSLIDWPSTLLLAHHTAFDGAILSWRYGYRPKFYLDTLSMARPQYSVTVGCGLAALSKHFGIGEKGAEVDEADGKRLADFTPEELARYGAYCVNDVNLTYDLFKLLNEGFPKSELKLIDCMLRMYTDPMLVFDRAILEQHLGEVQAKKAALLENLGVSKDDLMSNDKFAEVLTKLGVVPPTKVSVKTGKESWAFAKTDPEFLELLEHEDPEVQGVVAARLGVKSTLEETRTEAFLGVEGRGTLPIMLNYYGGHTGRASGGDKVNLQNLPRGGNIRKALKAPEGHLLVACDSAQIEARINAWLSDEYELVNAFAKNEDIYSKFASRVYGYEVTKATHKIERHVGKTCILGLGFGMGAAKLQRSLETGNPSVIMTEAECSKLVKTYRNTYPKIQRLWYKAADALNAISDNVEMRFGANDLLYTSKDGIHLPNGMVMRYAGLHQDHASGNWYFAKLRKEYTALAKMRFLHSTDPEENPMDYRKLTYLYGPKVVENVVQALARIVVMDQMVAISRRYKTVLTVHDEVVCCVPEDEAQDCMDYMVACMSTPPTWAPDLPIACEADMGVSYGDAK